VVVVFPASMWAIMPIFRYFSSGCTRAILTTSLKILLKDIIEN
jgi:hypothetical protein